MYSCPHCSAPAISGWRKASSSPLFPVRCPICGGHSAASGWARAVTAAGAEITLWGSIVFALSLGSPIGLLALPVGLFSMTAVVNIAFPLVATDGDPTVTRKRAAKHFGIVMFVAAAIVFALEFKWPNAV
jgi:hypothetical protein